MCIIWYSLRNFEHKVHRWHRLWIYDFRNIYFEMLAFWRSSNDQSVRSSSEYKLRLLSLSRYGTSPIVAHANNPRVNCAVDTRKNSAILLQAKLTEPCGVFTSDAVHHCSYLIRGSCYLVHIPNQNHCLSINRWTLYDFSPLLQPWRLEAMLAFRLNLVSNSWLHTASGPLIEPCKQPDWCIT